MTDYKSSIGISIKLDPQNKIKNDLEILLAKLSQTNTLNLNINPEINKQLKDVANNLNNIYNQTNKPFLLNSLTKSAQDSAKVFQSIGDEIGKLHEKSDLKINTKNGLQEAKEVNRTLKENYEDEIRLANQIQDTWNKVYKERVSSEQEALKQIELNEKKAYDDEILRLGQKAILEKKAEEDLANQMAKGREKSELKSQKIDRSQEISQSKAINKALEEEYKLQQEKQMMLVHQTDLYKQIDTLEKNGFLNESDITKLKDMVNSLEKMKDMHNVMNSIKDATNKESSIVSISKQLEDAQFKLEKMKTSLGNKLPNRFVESTVSELNKIKNEFKNIDGTNFNSIKNSLNQVNLSMREVSEQARNSESLFGKLGNSLRNVGIYIDITDVVRGVTNSIRDSIDTVIRMDSALGSLNKVVSMSQSQLQQMRDSAIDMGKELGRSSIEIANAQAEFGRLYKTQNEINNMTKVSVMGANVMDGVSSAEVAKGLTTVISSMKLEAKDSMDILDSMNEIQNNYRVGANDLLNALAEVGSTAYTSGTNLKQVEGYITSIAVATGKSGDEIGTALKSIMSRVYKLGEEGLEAEGKPEKMLNDMGVAVRDTSGNFRDFSAILSDLDIKWRSMSNTERIATAQVVAGVHRYNDFMSLMNNYQMAIDSTNTALNSQGSALKENEIHLQTAEAKLGILKATTEEFYMKLINSDAIKSTIDGLTTLVSTFGNLPTIVGLATSALILFKGEAIVGAISSIYGYITSLVSLASTEGIVATATSELSLVMATNPFGLIAIAIAGVTVGLVSMNKYLEESTDYIGKMNDATKGLQEMKTGENLIKQYGDLNTVINNTSSTTEQVANAKEKLIGVQKQLASQFPNLIDGYTKEGDALVRNINLVEEKINKDKKMLIAQAESNYGNLINQIDDKQMNKFNDTTSDSVWWLPSTWKSDIETYNNLLKESENTEEGLSENRKNKLTELSTKFGDLNKAIITMKDNGQDISGKQMFDFSTGKLVDAKEYLKDIERESQRATDKTKLVSNAMKDLNSGSNLSSNTIDELAKAYPDLGINASNANDKIAELNKTISNGNSNGTTSIEEATDSYNEATQAIAKAQGYIDKLNKAQAVTPVLAGQISKSYEDVGTSINDMGSTIDFLKEKILEEQETQENALMIMKGSDNDYYSQKVANNEAYQNQINNFLNSFVENGQGAYNIDLSNYSNLNQMKSGAMNTLKGAVDAFMSQFVDTSAQGYSVDYANFSNLISAKKAVMQQMAGALAQFWDESSQAFTQNAYGSIDLSGSADQKYYDEYTKKAQGILDIRDKIRSAESKLDGIYAGGGLSFQGFAGGGGGVSDFSGTGGGSGGKSGKSDAEKAQEEAEKWADKINELNSEIKTDQYYEANNAITQLDTKMKSLKTSQDGLTGSELQESRKKEIEVMNQQIEAYKHLEELQGYERDHIASILSNYGILTDSTGKLTNAYEVLSEAQLRANSMSGNTEDEYNEKKEAIEQVKQLNEYITKYGEIVNNTIPETTSKWQELTNEIKKANEETKKANEETLKSFRDTLAQDILKDAQDEVDDLKEKLANEKENEIKELEERKKATIESYDEQIKSLQDELNSLDDESVDNQIKLKKLQQELSEWQKDDSTEAQGKIQDLNEQIKELQKSIKKDSLQKEIDDLNEQKQSESDDYDKQLDDLNNYYDEQEKTAEDTYKEMLSEKRAYAKADKLITKNDQEAILKILEDNSESYKDVGTLLGTNFRDAFIEQIQQAKDALSELMNTDINKGSSGGSSSSNDYENSTSSGKNYTVIDGGIISDSPLTSEEQDDAYNSSSSSSSSSGGSKYQGGTTSDGQTFYFASYDTGGRTPSDIDNGALGILHSDEKILNAEDTIMLDNIYKYIKSTGSIIDTLSSYAEFGYLNSKIVPPTSDLNNLTSSIVNNTNNSSNSSSLEINNTYNVDATSDFNTKNFGNNLTKQFKDELRKAGILKK